MIPTQEEVAAWVAGRFPNQTSLHWRITKLAEEAGEVNGAFVKMYDCSGRKTKDDLAQETAQLMICALGVAAAAGFDLLTALDTEWRRTKEG